MSLLEEILPKLKPYVLGWITDVQLSSIGSHDLSGKLHAGTLFDSQAPQFLKTDGTRALIGNLLVADGAMIDGVDLSILGSGFETHIANENAHHDVVTVLDTATIDMVVTGQQVSANVILSANYTWTGLHVFQQNMTARSIFPELTDTYDLGSSTLLWRKGWLSELDTIIFSEQTITLLGGWLMITKDQGAFGTDVAAGAATIDFGKTMTPNDFLVIRSSLQSEYIQIGILVSGTTYNVSRDLVGSGASPHDWPAGTPWACLGQSGNGRIELNASDTPRIQLLKQGASYNLQTEVLRIGDLNGYGDYATVEYGLVIGEYGAALPNLTFDTTNGVRLRIGTTDYIVLDPSGDALISGVLQMPGTNSALAIGATPPVSAASGTGLWLDRTGLYSLSSSVEQVRIDAVDGKLYAGSGYTILDKDGMTLIATSNGFLSTQSVGWKDIEDHEFANIFGFVGAGEVGIITRILDPLNIKNGYFGFEISRASATPYSILNFTLDPLLGSSLIAGGAADGTLIVSGRISSYLSLGMKATATVPTSDGVYGELYVTSAEELHYKSPSGVDVQLGKSIEAAKYTQTKAQSIPTATETILDFDVLDFDTNTLVTTGASWKFTAKKAGIYSVEISFLINSIAWTAGNIARLFVYKNGFGFSYLSRHTTISNVTQYLHMFGSDKFQLEVDDYLHITLYHTNSSAVTLYTDPKYNHISIARVA
jgi:hypothetical protein